MSDRTNSPASVVNSVESRLGPCHYGGFGEDATVIAVTQDGVGWIAVCDRHRRRAVDEGYELHEIHDKASFA